ncbi:hypothetical protein DCAR_0311269 [Daucus carota subsp. sativus]|uniref:Uncharacterized protein n=1 Tax=Daucus carota subsp. sativus TaxID=79200 RepID=A0A166AGT8_DAUCS|nr:PREDICTED: phytohormone-binding protein-like [Daucus carota subsp. sativus]WOG92013.1 hypothetical protein DCAR_0311269 [Daucus carota subsp. sativus]
MKELKAQAKVGVGIKILWGTLAKDLCFALPKIIPNSVKEAQILEGDGGIGTVFLFKFGSDVKKLSDQKEKIVELDESLHLIALQVIEGGHLNHGFTSYKTSFQLSAITDSETLVDVIVVYETEAEATLMPSQTTNSALAFLKCVETYVLNQGSLTNLD